MAAPHQPPSHLLTAHAYPPTRIATVTDLLHGEAVADPYRWLEDGASAETIAWTDAQNAATRVTLDRAPDRTAIASRLAELLAIGSIEAPTVRGERLFYQRRAGDQNQPVLYYRERAASPEQTLLDPNTLAADGTVALDWWSPANDGRLLAYGLSHSGDERSTLHLLDVERGSALPERIEQTRAASIAWLPDGSGFYYTRYPAPEPENPDAANYHRRVYRHQIGTDPAKDPLVFGEGRAPTDWPSVELDRAGRWLVVSVEQGWSRTEVYLRDESRPEQPFTPLLVDEEAVASLELAGGLLYFRTNLGAPNYRLFAIDPARPAREQWREIVAERPEAVLEWAAVAGGRLTLGYLENATSRLRLAALDGSDVREVALPDTGQIEGFGGEPESTTAYLAFSSFTRPSVVYQLDPTGGALKEWARIDAPLDASPYETRQVWYDSTDGARVSMFLVHRRGLTPDGDTPTLLTGYGGFNIAETPLFRRNLYLWLERGGLFALPNLRGGGEYGEAWHRAGMREQKQHTFDDFIAAAEYLIAASYTTPARLAILGGSNGGLLVGAAITQRPELFAAAVCAVPLLDMLRYHLFAIARLWIPEYGDPDHPEQYRWLRAYSPYHHIREGERYPAVLLLTGESDSRVEPMHARKMAARLQSATGSERPILLRVEQNAGHGAGKPLAKRLAEESDIWSFLWWQVGAAQTPTRSDEGARAVFPRAGLP